MYRLAGLENKPINTETVAFQVAPRLNAAGRMGQAGDSLQLLVTRDESEAEILARRLESQNQERRELTAAAFEAAAGKAGLTGTNSSLYLHRRTGNYSGSGRSRGRKAVPRIPAACRCPGLRRQGYFRWKRAQHSDFQPWSTRSTNAATFFFDTEGIPRPAGFSVRRENVPALQARLCGIAATHLAHTDTAPALEIDAEVGLSELTPKLLSELELIEPFGVGNPRPIFMSRGLKVEELYRIGKAGQYLKLVVSDGRKRFPVLIFNRAAEWDQGTERIDLAFTLSVDTWQGKTRCSLVAEDYRVAGAGGS